MGYKPIGVLINSGRLPEICQGGESLSGLQFLMIYLYFTIVMNL